MNKNSLIVIAIVIVIVVAGGSFYGGMMYGQSQRPSFRGVNGQQFAGRRGANGQNLANGQVIAKDDKSVTLKLMNGGSQIIFTSASTSVMKSDPGSLTDVAVGQTVSVTGTANTDGSFNAQSIQIRPAIANNQSPTNTNQAPVVPPAQ